jgi:imidazolonepropionase-like amidohydrolase
MFSFSHGILEFQAMVKAGVTAIRALRSATSVAAELLGRDDLGSLASGKLADIVAMPGDPLADIAATANVDFRDERWRRLPQFVGRERKLIYPSGKRADEEMSK